MTDQGVPARAFESLPPYPASRRMMAIAADGLSVWMFDVAPGDDPPAGAVDQVPGIVESLAAGRFGISEKWNGAAIEPHTLPVVVRIAKGDIWRRATDAEAETIDAALSAQPIRLRNLFRDAAYLASDDELWPTLQAGFVAAFGASRAAELLAPSA